MKRSNLFSCAGKFGNIEMLSHLRASLNHCGRRF